MIHIPGRYSILIIFTFFFYSQAVFCQEADSARSLSYEYKIVTLGGGEFLGSIIISNDEFLRIKLESGMETLIPRNVIEDVYRRMIPIRVTKGKKRKSGFLENVQGDTLIIYDGKSTEHISIHSLDKIVISNGKHSFFRSFFTVELIAFATGILLTHEDGLGLLPAVGFAIVGSPVALLVGWLNSSKNRLVYKTERFDEFENTAIQILRKPESEVSDKFSIFRKVTYPMR